MTNNKSVRTVNPLDVPKVENAKKRLNRAYARLLRNGKRGGWRAVARDRDVNVRYVWELVVNNVVPVNPDIRVKLGLPRVMPSERVRRAKRALPKVWESPESYLKKVVKK